MTLFQSVSGIRPGNHSSNTNSKKETITMSNKTNTPETDVETVAIEQITDLKLEVANEAAQETEIARQRVHASELISASSRLTVQDPILHVSNLTLWSNQMGVNLAEGKAARTVTEQGVIKAAFNVLSDFRTKADVVPVFDQNGLFQLKSSWAQLASMPDNANIGVVNALYTGEFADEIVGFLNSKANALANAKNEAQKLAATRCWFRIGVSAGQLKIEKRLVNLDAAPDEGDEVTHMRRQIMRATATKLLLESEATGTPLLFKWEYQFGFVAAWYIGQFLKPAKVAFEEARTHMASSQIYKKEVRFRTSLAEQPDGTVPVKKTVATNNGARTETVVSMAPSGTLVLNKDGGMIDLADPALVGHTVTRWITPTMPYAGIDLTIAAENIMDLVGLFQRRHLYADVH